MKNLLLVLIPILAFASCNSNKPTSRPVQNAFLECGVTVQEHDRLMGLSQDGFDQDFDGGWRAISYQEGCKSVAAYLIEDYIAKHKVEPHTDNNILFWHVGQMHASAGDYKRAEIFFNDAYTPNLNPEEHGYEWSLYAQGTISFLQRDLISLTAKRDTLAALEVSEDLKQSRRKFLADNPTVTMPDGFVDEPQNLTPLNNLIACFEEPYTKAYSGKCKKATK